MFFRLISCFIPAHDHYDKCDVALGTTDEGKTIKSIYFVLSVLDTKASSLMRLNGVVLAAALVGVSARFYEIRGWPFVGTTMPSVVSMILCLLVVAVDWPFLGHVIPKTGGSGYDYSNEIEQLRKVRLFREWAYRFAWFFSFISALFFAHQLWVTCM
jgi:CBS domain containing-hemolysin-like protein